VEREAFTEIFGVRFDLRNDRFHLLIASGNELRVNSVGEHLALRAASAESVLLTDPQNLTTDVRVMVLIHGAFMVVAWIGTTTFATFMSRYFKNTWKKQMCGREPWFIIHTVCMTLTVLLTLAAFIIIFIDVNGFSNTYHSNLGIAVTSAMILQLFGAIFRPVPNHENRPIFNWLHKAFGNLTHVLAIITIFFAVPLPAGMLPDYTSYVLVGFVGFYLLMHIIMTVSDELQAIVCLQLIAQFQTIKVSGEIKRKRSLNKPDKLAPVSFRVHRLNCTQLLSLPFQYPMLRKNLLGVFMVAVLLFVVALVLIVAFAPF